VCERDPTESETRHASPQSTVDLSIQLHARPGFGSWFSGCWFYLFNLVIPDVVRQGGGERSVGAAERVPPLRQPRERVPPFRERELRARRPCQRGGHRPLGRAQARPLGRCQGFSQRARGQRARAWPRFSHLSTAANTGGGGGSSWDANGSGARGGRALEEDSSPSVWDTMLNPAHDPADVERWEAREKPAYAEDVYDGGAYDGGAYDGGAYEYGVATSPLPRSRAFLQAADSFPGFLYHSTFTAQGPSRTCNESKEECAMAGVAARVEYPPTPHDPRSYEEQVFFFLL